MLYARAESITARSGRGKQNCEVLLATGESASCREKRAAWLVWVRLPTYNQDFSQGFHKATSTLSSIGWKDKSLHIVTQRSEAAL